MTTPDQPHAQTPEALPYHPLPWHVGTNDCEPGSGGEPAFPCIHDSTGKPHGEDIVAQCLGDSDTVKAVAAFIVEACNQYASLTARAALCDELAEAAKNLLFASENADETGYVTDHGFIDIDAIYEKSRELLAKHAALAQKGRTTP